MNQAIHHKVLDRIYGLTPVVHLANTTDAPSGKKTYDDLLHLMAPRFQVALRERDYFLCHEEVVPHLRQLAAYQRRTGLTRLPGDHIVGIPGALANRLTANFAALNEYDVQALRAITEPVRSAGGVLLPYIQSSGSAAVAKALGLHTETTSDQGEKFNNKLWVKQAIDRYNAKSGRELIRQPAWRAVESPDQAVSAYRDLKRIAKGNPHSAGCTWIKMACAGGGNGTEKITRVDQIARWTALPHVQVGFERKDIHGGILMDVGIKGIGSPSANIYVGQSRETDKMLLDSAQFFSDAEGKEWIGNIGPLDKRQAAKIREQLEHIFDFLRSEGAYGLCGIDFILTEDLTVYLVEINFRITGAMAAGFVALEQGAQVFAAANEIPGTWGLTVDEIADTWDDEGILYQPGFPSGVFITNGLTTLNLGNAHPVIQGGIIARSDAEVRDILARAAIRQRPGRRSVGIAAVEGVGAMAAPR